MSCIAVAFDLVLLLQIPPWDFCLVHMRVCSRVREQSRKSEWESERASETVLCLRFAGTGRGFAWKEKDTLEHSMVIIRRDERRRKKDRGTKDLPGLSLYTGPLFFQWLMAHKWKQTLKGKMKTSLYFRPSALPRDPAQTPLCCQTTVELGKKSS